MRLPADACTATTVRQGAVVLPGGTIGDDTVVGARAVVPRDARLAG